MVGDEADVVGLVLISDRHVAPVGDQIHHLQADTGSQVQSEVG